MPRVRLQVVVLPWEEAGPSSDQPRQEILRPWLQVCTAEMTLQELAEEIVSKFASIYAGRGTLNIKHLETDFGDILDLRDVVGEVFDDRASNGGNRLSIVRVVRFPPDPTAHLRLPDRPGSLLPESSARPKKRQLRPLPPTFFRDARSPLPSVEGPRFDTFEPPPDSASKRQRTGSRVQEDTFGQVEEHAPLHNLHDDSRAQIEAVATQDLDLRSRAPRRSPQRKRKATTPVNTVDLTVLAAQNSYSTPTSLTQHGHKHSLHGRNEVADSPRYSRTVVRNEKDSNRPKSESPELRPSVHDTPPYRAELRSNHVIQLSHEVRGPSSSLIQEIEQPASPGTAVDNNDQAEISLESHAKRRQSSTSDTTRPPAGNSMSLYERDSWEGGRERLVNGRESNGGGGTSRQREDIYDPIESDTDGFMNKQGLHNPRSSRLSRTPGSNPKTPSTVRKSAAHEQSVTPLATSRVLPKRDQSIDARSPQHHSRAKSASRCSKDSADVTREDDSAAAATSFPTVQRPNGDAVLTASASMPRDGNSSSSEVSSLTHLTRSTTQSASSEDSDYPINGATQSISGSTQFQNVNELHKKHTEVGQKADRMSNTNSSRSKLDMAKASTQLKEPDGSESKPSDAGFVRASEMLVQSNAQRERLAIEALEKQGARAQAAVDGAKQLEIEKKKMSTKPFPSSSDAATPSQGRKRPPRTEAAKVRRRELDAQRRIREIQRQREKHADLWQRGVIRTLSVESNDNSRAENQAKPEAKPSSAAKEASLGLSSSSPEITRDLSVPMSCPSARRLSSTLRQPSLVRRSVSFVEPPASSKIPSQTFSVSSAGFEENATPSKIPPGTSTISSTENKVSMPAVNAALLTQRQSTPHAKQQIQSKLNIPRDRKLKGRATEPPFPFGSSQHVSSSDSSVNTETDISKAGWDDDFNVGPSTWRRSSIGRGHTLPVPTSPDEIPTSSIDPILLGNAIENDHCLTPTLPPTIVNKNTTSSDSLSLPSMTAPKANHVKHASSNVGHAHPSILSPASSASSSLGEQVQPSLKVEPNKTNQQSMASVIQLQEDQKPAFSQEDKDKQAIEAQLQREMKSSVTPSNTRKSLSPFTPSKLITYSHKTSNGAQRPPGFRYPSLTEMKRATHAGLVPNVRNEPTHGARNGVSSEESEGSQSTSSSEEDSSDSDPGDDIKAKKPANYMARLAAFGIRSPRTAGS